MGPVKGVNKSPMSVASLARTHLGIPWKSEADEDYRDRRKPMYLLNWTFENEQNVATKYENLALKLQAAVECDALSEHSK
ncbi:hypothetical protein STEG23_008974 [Scotinomys teguina]